MNYTSKRLKPFGRAIFLRAHGNTMHGSAKKSHIIMSKSNNILGIIAPEPTSTS